MCLTTENYSCKAEIKTEPMDEYPDFTTFSGLSQPEIKQEPSEIKQESVEIMQTDEIEDFSRPWETYNDPDPVITERKIVFECRICIQRKIRNPKKFTSIIALTKHIHNHTKRCEDCRQVFKTWKEVHEHEKFCPRRFGVCDRRPERSQRAPKPLKLRYKCQLCKRKYQTKDHLLNHQINRCAARYRTHAWVVKI